LVVTEEKDGAMAKRRHPASRFHEGAWALFALGPNAIDEDMMSEALEVAQEPMPEEVCDSLQLPPGSTHGEGVAEVRRRKQGGKKRLEVRSGQNRLLIRSDDPVPSDVRAVGEGVEHEPVSAGGDGLRWARDIAPTPVTWVPGAADLLPRRVVGLLAGPRDIGKSLLVARLAADVTIAGGFAWVNSLEDDLHSVVRPRCDMAGVVTERARLSSNHYQFPRDLSAFGQELQLHAQEGRNDALVVLDSLQQHLPKYLQAEAAIETMQGLRTLAEELNVCILLVAHLTKSLGDTVEAAIGGAGALQNLAKFILLLGPQPHTPEDQVAAMFGEALPAMRVLAAERLGVGPLPEARLYRLTSRRYEPTDRSEAYLDYVGTSTATSREVLHSLHRHAAGPDKDETKQMKSAAWIVQTLTDVGPMPTRELERSARAAGVYSSANTFDRARKLAEVEAIPPTRLKAVLGEERYAELTDELRRVHWVRSGWTGAPLPRAANEEEEVTPPDPADTGDKGEWGSTSAEGGA
jgi:AAA domain-containing protein